MPYVERDENGKIVGVYANLQEGYAEEELADDDTDLVAFLNPPIAYIIPKLLLWTRLTDTEATAVDTAMASQSAKLRGIWNSATEVRSDSEFFGILKAFLSGALSPGRAEDLLEPEVLQP